MKRGELILLWIGTLLSTALLIIDQNPDHVLVQQDLDLHLVSLFAKLAAIWIICGLVWLSLYRRALLSQNP